MFRRLVLVFVYAAALSVPACAQSAVDLASALDRVEAMTKAEQAKDNLASVTIGVVSGAELVWTRSFGYADIEGKVAADKDSVYRIGSITKQFTGLMLLQLAHAGKVRFSDPVEKYFPEVNQVTGRPASAPPITLIGLATMTSGLDREPSDLPTYLKGPVSEWEKVLVAALPRTKYQFEPDTRFFYSNIGYAILGAALGRASGAPYVEYVKEHVFTPLGMSRTAFEPNPQVLARLAKGYEVGRDGKLDAGAAALEHGGRGYKVPNGAIYTTVVDLARFVAFELGAGPESVLPKKTWEENLARTNSSAGDLRSGYGVGFMVSRSGDFVTYGHGGSVAGYRAEALFHPPSKTGVIVLRNVGGGKFDISGLAQRALQEVAAARSKPRT